MENKLVYFYRFQDADGEASSGVTQLSQRIIDNDGMRDFKRQLSEQYYTQVTDVTTLQFLCRVNDLPAPSSWIVAERIADDDSVKKCLSEYTERPGNDAAVSLIRATIEAIRQARGD